MMSHARSWGAAAAALLLAVGSGCATTGDVERLEARVAVIEQFNEALKRSMAEDVERVEKLHAMMTEAEETLRKSGANLGLRLERIEESLPKQVGDTEMALVRLKRIESDLDLIKRELADRLGTTQFFLPADLPKDKDGMWQAGETAAKAQKVREAQAIFELYEANFPDDPRAPQALFEIAVVMEAAGDTEEAVRFYQRVFDRHRASALAPDAVLRIAELYLKKSECGRAKSIFKFVADEFKGTPAAETAKARTKQLGKDCKK